MKRWLLLASLGLFAACINNSIFQGSESNPDSLETKFLQARWYFDHNEPEKAKPLNDEVLASLEATTEECSTLALSAEEQELCTRAKSLKGKIELVQKGISTLKIASQLADVAAANVGGIEALLTVLVDQTADQKKTVAEAADAFAESAGCVEDAVEKLGAELAAEECGLTKDDAKVAAIVTGLDAINKLQENGVIIVVNNDPLQFKTPDTDPETAFKVAKDAGAVKRVQNALTFAKAGLAGDNLTEDEEKLKGQIEEAQCFIDRADRLCDTDPTNDNVSVCFDGETIPTTCSAALKAFDK